MKETIDPYRIPPNLTGKALFTWLIENKQLLINKKKSMPVFTSPLSSEVTYISPLKDGGTKASGASDAPIDPDTLRVNIVGNAAWYCDQYLDVLTDKSYDKTIEQKSVGGVFPPHIKDHIYSSTSHVGDVLNVYTKRIQLKKLGLQQDGSTVCVCWETDIRKAYDEKVFLFYGNGKINQHSIGLWYVKIELAVNDENYQKEYEIWKKNYEKIINKEPVDKYGFFWLVSEIKLIEVSCVLFGANELTPTLSSVESKSITDEEPVTTTLAQPKKSTFNFALLNN